MSKTTPDTQPLPSSGGSFVLVKGKLVKLPEPDQQTHASEAGSPAKGKE